MSLLYRLLDFSTAFGGMQELKQAANRIMNYYEQYKEICQRYNEE